MTTTCTEVTRVCRECGASSAEVKFKAGANICVPCNTEYKNRWRANNPEKVQAYRSKGKARWELRHRAKRLGLDPDFIEQYVADHDGRCEICSRNPLADGDDRGLFLDHNHETNEFRGLLCNNCNAGIGRFLDNPELLESAAGYLRKPGDLARLLQARMVSSAANPIS